MNGVIVLLCALKCIRGLSPKEGSVAFRGSWFTVHDRDLDLPWTNLNLTITAEYYRAGDLESSPSSYLKDLHKAVEGWVCRGVQTGLA